MATPQNVATKIDELRQSARQTLHQENETNYETLQNQVVALEALAREAFQAKLERICWPIIQKLEGGKALTTADHDVLQILLVGEASYYLKAEQNLEAWRAEVERLIEEITKRQVSGLDEIDSLLQVRALCREAMRILPDLAYYFREKQRLRQFEQTTTGPLDPETRRNLANLLKEMLTSDQL